jgi:ribosome biogenesis GTPase
MREFQLWSGGESVAESFPDIAELGAGCRFRDCQHGNEPDCAVRAAATTGALAPERYQGYLKLKNELENISRGRRLPRPGGRPRHRPMAPCDDPDEEL